MDSDTPSLHSQGVNRGGQVDRGGRAPEPPHNSDHAKLTSWARGLKKGVASHLLLVTILMR